MFDHGLSFFFFLISIYSVYHIKFFFLIDDSLVHIGVCTFNQFIYIYIYIFGLLKDEI